MKKALVIILLLAAAAAAIIAGCSGSKAPTEIAFAATYTDALKEAGEGNKQMLITFFKDS
jgi:hypothetical protein